MWGFAQWASEQEKLLAKQGNLPVLALDDWMGVLLSPVSYMYMYLIYILYSQYFRTTVITGEWEGDREFTQVCKNDFTIIISHYIQLL